MPKKILFVDDEKDILEVVSLILENEGFKVKTAADINSAKEVISYMPDLIIFDALLIKKTAEDICKTLKKNVITKNIPVIILSAQSLSNLSIIAKNCNAKAFLQKPFESKELIELVRKFS